MEMKMTMFSLTPEQLANVHRDMAIKKELKLKKFEHGVLVIYGYPGEKTLRSLTRDLVEDRHLLCHLQAGAVVVGLLAAHPYGQKGMVSFKFHVTKSEHENSLEILQVVDCRDQMDRLVEQWQIDHAQAQKEYEEDEIRNRPWIVGDTIVGLFHGAEGELGKKHAEMFEVTAMKGEFVSLRLLTEPIAKAKTIRRKLFTQGGTPYVQNLPQVGSGYLLGTYSEAA